MYRFLTTLDEDQPQRTAEEYLGAFTESMKLIERESSVERVGHAVLLAAKTALRLKAAMPNLGEHEIASRLQSIARNIRLFEIFKDLTPEEKGIIKINHDRVQRGLAAAAKTARRAPGAGPSRAKKPVRPRRRG